jgi:membrane protein
MNWNERRAALEAQVRETWHDWSHFPWKNTALTLSERFREDRLGLTASSLTFTTLTALVPLFTVALAIFTAMPMFEHLQVALQRWLVSAMVPEGLSRSVLLNFSQFIKKATQMGWAGGAFFVITALALIFTIDRKLNDIWRVRRARGVTQRVLVYWSVLTLGPVVLALSLTLTAYAFGDQRALVKGLSLGSRFWVEAMGWVLSIASMAALYRYVPNTHVRWSHALIGGVFVSIGFELGKALLSWYFSLIPTFSVVYGAFATVPILLVWIYMAWVIVLLGAVVAAYLPSLLSGIARRGDTPGWDFQIALEILEHLFRSKSDQTKGLTLSQLSQVLKVSPLQLEEALAALAELDWVASLKEDEERHVLLVDPLETPLKPLIDKLLLHPHAAVRRFGEQSAWSQLKMSQALQQAQTFVRS